MTVDQVFQSLLEFGSFLKSFIIYFSIYIWERTKSIGGNQSKMKDVFKEVKVNKCKEKIYFSYGVASNFSIFLISPNTSWTFFSA